MTRLLTVIVCTLALLAGSLPVYANGFDGVTDFRADRFGGEEEDHGDQEEGDEWGDQDDQESFYALDDVLNPEAQPRRWRDRDHRRRNTTVCFARNAWGNTYQAAVRGRVDTRRLQWQAVQNCRRGSPFFLQRSCRAAGCRVYR